MAQEFFVQRPAVTPTIYVYNLPQVSTHKGYVKVGYTDRDAVTRINEQMHTSGLAANILYTESAMCSDGSIFTDKDVHRILRRKGFRQMNEGSDRNEWFNCSVADVKAAIVELKTGIVTDASRTATFKMRPEQYQAVKRTMEYYAYVAKEDPGRPPKFLWNAKMRFGKTFASYQLVKKMGFKRILVLTFKPAVESAWREDLMTHVDFDGWQFISNKDAAGNHVNIDREYARADKSKPIVVFGSFQDLLGTNESGGIKAKNEFIHTDNWDLVIFDEYHFGAWRENAKKLFENPDDEEAADFDAEKYQLEEAGNAYNETFLPITTSHYLFLSGTPFRAINSGEFIEDQIYNWTYSDEQRAKENWVGSNNPYEALPRMVMLTYRIPDSIRQIAMQGEFNEFDLNVFFSAKGKGDEAKFLYENEVQKWLDLIRGSYLPSNIDDMKLGQDKRPPMPYQMLIFSQCPHATLVAGYQKWQNQFSRHVLRGEKGISILAPTPYKIKVEKEKLDPDTKLPLLDADGNTITEEKEVQIPMFRPVKVFDVSQTDGKPLPERVQSPVAELTGNVEHYEAFMEALRRVSPVPIEMKPLSNDLDGFFSPSKQSITLRAGMSEVQTVCAAVH